MKVIHCEQMEATPVDSDGAAGCRMRCLIGPDDAAPSFSMRHFEVAPGGHTPKHAHAHEHEVFVLEGSGVVLEGDRELGLRPAWRSTCRRTKLHQFRNTGSTTLKFLCLIPHPIRGMREMCVAACGCDG